MSKGFRTEIGRIDTHHDVVRYAWELYAPNRKEPVALGTQTVILDEKGRMLGDLQFTMHRMGMNAHQLVEESISSTSCGPLETALLYSISFSYSSRIEMDKNWDKETVRQMRLFDAFNIIQLKLEK